MKRSKSDRLPRGLLIVVLVFCIGGLAHNADASLIYHESFSGSGNLNETAPDTRPGSETWTASDWQQDGTIANQGAGADNAFLPFTPVTGRVYTLTSTLDAVVSGTQGSSWTALGFANGSDTTVDFWKSPNDAGPWALYRATGPADQVVTFTGLGVTGSASEGTFTGPITLSIVLDTNPAQWNVEWFVNGGSVRTHTYTSNPDISTVGFGRNNDSDGPISSFTLSDDLAAIPEPTAVLGLLGLITGTFFRRRRRTLA